MIDLRHFLIPNYYTSFKKLFLSIICLQTEKVEIQEDEKAEIEEKQEEEAGIQEDKILYCLFEIENDRSLSI